MTKILFMGTPDFAVPCLEKLYQHYDIIGVVTQPDRPKGRGQNLAISPVKSFALEHQLPIYQPEKVRTPEFISTLKKLAPDFIIVVAFGQILPKEILDIPKYACINVHASLLPRWRGAAPIHWSIIAGDKQTGVTTMLMDVGLDTGDMLLKSTIEITPEMTTAELHDKLMLLGADTLIKTIEGVLEQTVIPEKQDDSLANYASMLNKENTRIDWHKSSKEIHNLIRGLNCVPLAYTFLEGKRFKIWQSKITTGTGNPGEIIDLTKEGIVVATGDGALLLTQIQPPNKGKMLASDYINGHKEQLVSGIYFE